MSRLTKDKIKQHRAALERWQRPEEMLRHYEEIRGAMTGEEFFNQPGIQFVRDAWAAATLGTARSAEEVRLIPEPERWPDFALRRNGMTEQWEVTEADIPGRRRGEEYQYDPLIPGDRALGLDHPENYIARAERAPEAIRAACTKKAAKNYSSSVSLLVYLNISDFGARHEQVVSSFPDATRAAKDKFNEVWVLWKNCAYRVWPMVANEAGA